MTDEQWLEAHDMGWEYAQRMVDAGRSELMEGRAEEMWEAILAGFWDKLFELSGNAA